MAEEKEVMQNIDINEFDNVQTLKDDLYQSILTITGVPNRNGGSSTSYSFVNGGNLYAWG